MVFRASTRPRTAPQAAPARLSPDVLTRRRFLRGAASLAALPLMPRLAWGRTIGANERLSVAKIAVGGMGWSDLNEIATHTGVHIAAVCDVDARHRPKLRERFPDAPWFGDWRELLATLGDKVDAVVISTPDHMHAPISMRAMQLGKHVYCQKPLGHSALENRRLAEFAAAHPKAVTQMGTQRSAMIGRRQQLALLQEGRVGRIESIHAWSDRPMGWWPQGGPRPTNNQPVPEWLAWDLFLGVAPDRPYVPDAYHPFMWRGTYDFGCGALGDMGCHILDYPFLAAGLTYPVQVRVDANDGTDDQYPAAETITLTYASTERTMPGGVKLTWYDGGRRPTNASLGIPEGVDIRGNAVVVIGEKGVMLCPLDPERNKDGQITLSDEPLMWDRSAKAVILELPRLDRRNHWHHWIDGCFGKAKPEAGFGFAGLLCESLSVGAAASRFPNRDLAYDAKAIAFPQEPAASALLRKPYREGWSVDGLAG
jgi:predicted dehydrogenase